ncbi:MAG: class I SAM-dependent methyltransferase [Gammaproteobacteria bacterium]|nr:class I SAM-dependent methyltransferase [Gammaproteobacteria bacterium]
MDRKQHWEDVYRHKPEHSLSWFQPQPEISLQLIHAAGLSKTDAIMDVGAGVSRLADQLLAEGFSDLTLLDIAEPALQITRMRLGAAASRVHWIVDDVTIWKPARQYRLWHDRAVFHFLTEASDRKAYRENLQAALASGGSAILASFDLHGPERCSGLPVQRYSPESLAAELGSGFRLSRQRSEAHQTPAGRIQQFQYSMFEFRP